MFGGPSGVRDKCRTCTDWSSYPQQNLDIAWKNILFNQFHDILPGSGIHINYVDAARKYAVASRIDRDIIHTGLSDIASRVHLSRRERADIQPAVVDEDRRGGVRGAVSDWE